MATTFRLPAVGPRDVTVWLTLCALCRCDLGSIDPDAGEVWVADTAAGARWRLDPAHLDALIELGWVDDGTGHDELKVTGRGHYWASRFRRLNGSE